MRDKLVHYDMEDVIVLRISSPFAYFHAPGLVHIWLFSHKIKQKQKISLIGAAVVGVYGIFSIGVVIIKF